MDILVEVLKSGVEITAIDLYGYTMKTRLLSVDLRGVRNICVKTTQHHYLVGINNLHGLDECRVTFTVTVRFTF